MLFHDSRRVSRITFIRYAHILNTGNQKKNKSRREQEKQKS